MRQILRKGQFAVDDAAPMSFADQFYALAGQVRPVYAGVMLSMKKSVLGSTTRQNANCAMPFTVENPLMSVIIKSPFL